VRRVKLKGIGERGRTRAHYRRRIGRASLQIWRRSDDELRRFGGVSCRGKKGGRGRNARAIYSQVFLGNRLGFRQIDRWWGLIPCRRRSLALEVGDDEWGRRVSGEERLWRPGPMCQRLRLDRGYRFGLSWDGPWAEIGAGLVWFPRPLFMFFFFFSFISFSVFLFLP
jgi:hypothetical protein